MHAFPPSLVSPLVTHIARRHEDEERENRRRKKIYIVARLYFVIVVVTLLLLWIHPHCVLRQASLYLFFRGGLRGGKEEEEGKGTPTPIFSLSFSLLLLLRIHVLVSNPHPISPPLPVLDSKKAVLPNKNQ